MKAALTSIFFILIICISQAQTKTASYYVDEAHHLIEKKKYEEAVKVLTTGINEFPDSARLYDTRGTLLEAFRMYNEAIRDFSKGIEKSSDDKMKAHFLSNRGGSKYKVRDFEGSYKDLKEALRLDSTNIAALNNIAVVCDEVNRPDETLIYLYKIIEIDSLNSYAYMNMGFKYQTMNEHEKAIGFFDKSLELNPKEPFAYNNRAFSKLKLHDLKGAMKDVNQSLKLNPGNSYAYKNRALIYIEEKKYKDACADLTKANELGYTKQYGKEVNELISKYCN